MSEITRNDIYTLFWAWKHEGKWMHPDAFEEDHGFMGDSPLTRTTSRHFSMVVGRKWFSASAWEGDKLDAAEIEICKRLLGPHGYSYYRVLLAQKEEASHE